MTPRDQYLVSTQWLADHLGDPNLRLFDCTGIADQKRGNTGRDEHYERHHIPGAAYLDIASPKGEMTDPDGAFPYTWPTQAQFEATMGALGVGAGNRVVIYSGSNPLVAGSGFTWATRAWWLMHHFGVDCAILEGGWEKWKAEGRAVESGSNTYPPTTFRAAPGWERGRADRHDVLAALGDPASIVVDSLSPESYRGEGSRIYGTFGARKGHITGAVNLDYASLLDAHGCFLPDEALREKFAAAGVSPDKRVITYCGGGIGATMDGLALKLLGYQDIAIYDASLMEWANDPSLPMTDLTQEVPAG